MAGGDEKGTLANPYSIGKEMVDGDWSLTIDDVNLDANAEMAAKDSIISKVDPEPGNTWVILTATWTYNGGHPAEGGTSFQLALGCAIQFSPSADGVQRPTVVSALMSKTVRPLA